MISEIYNKHLDEYSVDPTNYQQNTDSLLLLLDLSGAPSGCYDQALKSGVDADKIDLFYPVDKETTQGCQNFMYMYRDTIKTLNILKDVIQQKRTADNSENIRTIQFNEISITGGTYICCASAIADPVKYGSCTDSIEQGSKINVLVNTTTDGLNDSEILFVTGILRDALKSDYSRTIDLTTCIPLAEREQIRTSIDDNIVVTDNIKNQFTKITQINKQDLDFKRVWSWGPCFDIVQDNIINLNIQMSQDIVYNIYEDVYNQFTDNNYENFSRIMNCNDQYILEDCQPDCKESITPSHPTCLDVEKPPQSPSSSSSYILKLVVGSVVGFVGLILLMIFFTFL